MRESYHLHSSAAGSSARSSARRSNEYLNRQTKRLNKKIFAAISVLTIMVSTAVAQQSSQPAPTPAPAKETVTAQNPDIGSQIRFPVEKYNLPNGLTVILHENRTAPIVSYQTWFRVGSKDEEPGYTGIAHLFEHMMFKGAKRYTGDQFDQLLQANGATNNAFTSHDYTGYYINLPSSKLELAIDIESDRMENLRISPDMLTSEREVVKEERRFRVDNNPMGVLRETLFGTSFRVHPYRWPVIGYMTDLNNINVDKAMEFYKTYYAPNNAVIIVSGDFDSTNVKALVNKYYGHMKSQTIPAGNRPTEPVQNAARSQMVARDVQTTQFAISYHTPKAGTDDAYALDLLANIMGQGESSRLHQRLVYKTQVATSAVAYNLTLQDSGMFQIYVTMKPGVNSASAQKAVIGEMWRPRNLPIKTEELTKAKNQVMKSYVDGLKTVHGRAEALAINEIQFGDYERLFKDLEKYNQVTAAQIRQVAEKYLTPEKATTVVLRPEAKGGRQ